MQIQNDMPDENETLDEYKKRIASLGGQANIKKHGKKRMSKIAKKGLAKRWGKKKSKLKEILFD